jgi:VanZ family protein
LALFDKGSSSVQEAHVDKSGTIYFSTLTLAIMAAAASVVTRSPAGFQIDAGSVALAYADMSEMAKGEPNLTTELCDPIRRSSRRTRH